MEIERAKEMIRLQLSLGGGYNRNSVRLILAEIQREYDQKVIDSLIYEFGLDRAFGIQVGEKIRI
jgi:hypothetical protein